MLTIQTMTSRTVGWAKGTGGDNTLRYTRAEGQHQNQPLPALPESAAGIYPRLTKFSYVRGRGCCCGVEGLVNACSENYV